VPCTGRSASPFIVEGEDGLQARGAKRKKIKKEREEREKQKEGVVYGVVPLLLLAGPLVVRARETSIISGSCSLLEQRASPVNPDETPHPATGVGGVK
jgi:hypothetical protein